MGKKRRLIKEGDRKRRERWKGRNKRDKFKVKI